VAGELRATYISLCLCFATKSSFIGSESRPGRHWRGANNRRSTTSSREGAGRETAEQEIFDFFTFFVIVSHQYNILRIPRSFSHYIATKKMFMLRFFAALVVLAGSASAFLPGSVVPRALSASSTATYGRGDARTKKGKINRGSNG